MPQAGETGARLREGIVARGAARGRFFYVDLEAGKTLADAPLCERMQTAGRRGGATDVEKNSSKNKIGSGPCENCLKLGWSAIGRWSCGWSWSSQNGVRKMGSKDLGSSNILPILVATNSQPMAGAALSQWLAGVDQGSEPRRARPSRRGPRARLGSRSQISQLPASGDEATAGSTPTTIKRDSSGCIRIAALTRKRASAAAAASKASPRSSTPLHGLDEILKTLFLSRLILRDGGGLRVVSRESCFRQGCCAVREHRRSHRE